MNLEDEGYLEKSIDYFSKGISMAKSHEQQSLLEKLEHQLCEAEKKKKGETQPAPKEAKPVQIATVTSQEAALKIQQAFEEANRHGTISIYENKQQQSCQFYLIQNFLI